MNLGNYDNTVEMLVFVDMNTFWGSCMDYVFVFTSIQAPNHSLTEINYYNTLEKVFVVYVMK